MCCFSRPVKHVSQTQIFARSASAERQFLVYSMNIALREDVAMILPLPTPPQVADDAVRFIDLSGYTHFFRDVRRAFPEVLLSGPKGGLLAAAPQARSTLQVHSVGLFEASFVPSLRDFNRLDERFRLPPSVWDKMPLYRDYGFAVFKLKRNGGLFSWLRRMRTIHPMAMEFPRRNPQSLFFPTVHVHDGQHHPEANFDHALYCQPDPHVEIFLDWEPSDRTLDSFVDVDRACGLITPRVRAYRRLIHGPGPNRDVVLDEDSLRATVVLGDHFLLRTQSAQGTFGTWPKQTPDERERIKQQLKQSLSILTQQHEDDWQLVKYRGDLPERWPTFYESFPETAAAPPIEPCRIKFFIWNQRIEPMEICLAFTEPPPRERRDTITAELQKLLDNAAGT